MNKRWVYLKDKRQWIKGVLFFALMILLVRLVTTQIGFWGSRTDSLPYHYFLQIKPLAPQRNEYTVVFSEWYGDWMIKKILGVAGDEIKYDPHGVLWVNETAVGLPCSHSSNGYPLTPLPAQMIPNGFVFLYAEHHKSFDSRYQELGLVPVSQLKGRVFPIR